MRMEVLCFFLRLFIFRIFIPVQQKIHAAPSAAYQVILDKVSVLSQLCSIIAERRNIPLSAVPITSTFFVTCDHRLERMEKNKISLVKVTSSLHIKPGSLFIQQSLRRRARNQHDNHKGIQLGINHVCVILSRRRDTNTQT